MARTDFDIVVVGAGAAGLAAIASIRKRRRDLSIAVVDPATEHFYQPGWTMVGGGIFEADQTVRPMEELIPSEVTWLRQPVASFEPESDTILLGDGSRVSYRQLVVATGLTLNWGGIDGLPETLGRNGVTSNYRFDLAPYTWRLVQGLQEGAALFTQPPMPIKCAGAPQKAMYLSCSHWERSGVLNRIDVQFHNAGGVLFGVADYVPALMGYVERYGIELDLNETLIAVDGLAKQATFRTQDGEKTVDFDMIHVVPPQVAPAVVAESLLAGEGGWVDVDQETLRHKRYENIFALGDCTTTPNAKTAAAARKQAPIVAANLLANIEGMPLPFAYDGYGSCPLTVERGKIVLAEFGYGGKLLPTFPTWLIDGTKPSRAAWWLKSEA
ncbi:FAD/NAD(P)-binding oxidoreductase, partial [Erythrobacter sp.]|uniref:NAD(P)/FAD-dependent oxidoreductase n=1 Tax=Erythrobacter sp. TaxID=1042 RepID=UPI00311D8AEB